MVPETIVSQIFHTTQMVTPDCEKIADDFHEAISDWPEDILPLLGIKYTAKGD